MTKNSQITNEECESAALEAMKMMTKRLEGKNGVVAVIVTNNQTSFVTSSLQDPCELAKYLQQIAIAEKHRAEQITLGTVH